MIRSNRKRVRGDFLLVAVVCCLAVAVVLPVFSIEAAAQQRNQPGGAKITVGEYPPDFELPYLTFDKGADGKPVGVISAKNTFKLSDHRGKKPVCMIMSSYT